MRARDSKFKMRSNQARVSRLFENELESVLSIGITDKRHSKRRPLLRAEGLYRRASQLMIQAQTDNNQRHDSSSDEFAQILLDMEDFVSNQSSLSLSKRRLLGLPGEHDYYSSASVLQCSVRAFRKARKTLTEVERSLKAATLTRAEFFDARVRESYSVYSSTGLVPIFQMFGSGQVWHTAAQPHPSSILLIEYLGSPSSPKIFQEEQKQVWIRADDLAQGCFSKVITTCEAS